MKKHILLAFNNTYSYLIACAMENDRGIEPACLQVYENMMA